MKRWNTHIELAAGWYRATSSFPTCTNLLPTPLPKTYGDFVDALAQRLVFRTLATPHRNARPGRSWARPPPRR